MNQGKFEKFARLFKKYRLRSEFETLSEFGNALAEKGIIYEDSLFSHWQKGSRIPNDRSLLLTIISLFVEKGGINNIGEINDFLESANQGYLTEREAEKFPDIIRARPFLVPHKIFNYITRDRLHKKALLSLQEHNILYITGPAGSGKSSLAIEIAHEIADSYHDGVLWFRADTTSAMDILLSIGLIFKQDVGHINNLSARSNFVKSFLNNKKILYIFDNIEEGFDLNLLIPNLTNNSVIITSNTSGLLDLDKKTVIKVQRFNEEEANLLYKTILGENYVMKHKKNLTKLSKLVDHLPLALQIVTKQIVTKKYSLNEMIEYIQNENYQLDQFKYEQRDLLNSLDATFKKLKKNVASVFLSLSVFVGKDFSLSAVTALHSFPEPKVKEYLHELINYSLIEVSTNSRYRINPFIFQYLRSKSNNKRYYIKAADYYTQLFNDINDDEIEHNIILFEQDNIKGVLLRCHQNEQFEHVCKLFTKFGLFLWETGQWDQLKTLSQIAYASARKINDSKSRMLICNRELSWVHYWTGDITKALKYTIEARDIAVGLSDAYYIAYTEERLSKIYQGMRKYEESISLSHSSLAYFQNISDHFRVSNNLRHLGETYLMLGDKKVAKEYLEAGLEEIKLISDKRVELIYSCVMLTELAAIHYLNKEYLRAKTLFSECMSMENSVKSFTLNRIWINIVLGLMYEKENNFFLAKEKFRLAEDACIYLGMKPNIAKISPILSILKQDLGSSIIYKRSPFLKYIHSKHS